MNTQHNKNLTKAAEQAKAFSAAALNALSATIATARATRDAIDAMHAAHAFLYESAAPDTPLHAVELKLHALLMKSSEAGQGMADVLVFAQDCTRAVEHRIEELRQADGKNAKGD
jgi:hypothetical protein